MSPAQAWHIIPFDCIGVEWPPVFGGERKLRFLRTMAARKPVSFLIFKMSGDVASAYQTYVGKLGVYGIFPPPRIRNMSGPSREADDLAAPYAKVLQQMYIAGWQPVTHARCDRKDLLVERYGPADGQVYFAIFNPSLSAARAHLTIDAKAIGMPHIARVAAYFCTQKQLGPAPTGDGRYQIPIEVPALRLLVLQAGVNDVDDPSAIVDYYPSKYRAWCWTHTRGKVRVELSAFGTP